LAASALPSNNPVAALLLAVVLAILALPVVALAMQPFSIASTLVAGGLASVAATTYARICFSR
jgi:hypothetical protein